jgi:MFS transporter, DHA1 family, multidrug resistance protein
VGSWFSESLGWRSIFWFVTGAGVVGLGLIVWILPETRSPAQRVGSSLGGALRGYAALMRDRHFMGLTFIGAFGMASFFLYLANSSFLLIDHFGLIPRHYGYAFSLNAGAIIGAAQFTGVLTKRYGLVGVVRRSVLGFMLTMVALLATHLWGIDRLDVLLALLFVGYSFLGLLAPITAVLALETHGEHAGTASALLGTFRMLVGGVLMGVVGLFFDGTARPMVVSITACAVVTWLLTRATLGRSAS